MKNEDVLIKTPKEAIETIKSNMPTCGYQMLRESLNMAIDALEKQIPKKCVIDSCPDHMHYKCPSCGKIQKTKYNDSTFGCILNNCSNCGQALINEDLEGMEDE